MIDLLNIALAEYGTKEIKGREHNPEVIKYFHQIGHKWVNDDETAWCAAFINWCCLNAGYEMSGKLNAQSFMDIGWEPRAPKLGDVVVFWRESRDSWKGHVALYIRETPTHIFVLGGNQQNEVNIIPYPKSRLLGYRRLKKL